MNPILRCNKYYNSVKKILALPRGYTRSDFNHTAVIRNSNEETYVLFCTPDNLNAKFKDD